MKTPKDLLIEKQRELTTDQKVFILETLRLSFSNKVIINGEKYYSEADLLEVLKRFNNTKFDDEQQVTNEE